MATLFGSGIFFLTARSQVARKFRPSIIVSAVVVFIAGYHYFRIFESWAVAFVLQDGSYVPSGIDFNEAYRYADWLITVPLLLIELVAVLGVSGATAAVGVQIGYSIADLTAKSLYGVFIYRLTRAKSEAEGFNLATADAAA